jgi:hypothetical protein
MCEEKEQEEQEEQEELPLILAAVLWVEGGGLGWQLQ